MTLQNDNILGLLKRLVLSMLIIGITNVIVPGMSNRGGLVNLALIAIVVAVLQHFLSNLFGSTKGANISTGFLVMAISLYLAGKFLNNYDVSILGAILGGIVYGFIDSIIHGDKL